MPNRWRVIWGVLAGLLLVDCSATRGDELIVDLRRWDDDAEQRVLLVAAGDSTLSVRVDGQPVKQVRLEELRSLRPMTAGVGATVAMESHVGKFRVELTTGDWLTAVHVEMVDDQLAVVPCFVESAETVHVPLEFVRSLQRLTGQDLVDRRTEQRMLDAQPWHDTLWLVNGDRIEGELTAISAAGCEVIAATGPVVAPAEQWLGAKLDPALSSQPATPANWAYIQLTNGDRLSSSAVKFSAGVWRVTTLQGFECTLPITAVARIDLWSDAAVPMTSLPSTVDYRPYLSAIPVARVDRSVGLTPLAIGSEQYGWGLGVWSGTKLRWELPNGVREFETLVGVDTSVASGGSVDFIVRVDGQERLRSGRRTGADAAMLLGPIDVLGAQEIELIADCADQADLLDKANWCRPILLK